MKMSTNISIFTIKFQKLEHSTFLNHFSHDSKSSSGLVASKASSCSLESARAVNLCACLVHVICEALNKESAVPEIAAAASVKA